MLPKGRDLEVPVLGLGLGLGLANPAPTPKPKPKPYPDPNPNPHPSQVSERVRAVNAILLGSCFFSTQRQVRAIRVRAGVRARGRGGPTLLHTAPGGLRASPSPSLPLPLTPPCP